MKKIIKCVICGNEFEAHSKKHKYCSYKCKYNARYGFEPYEKIIQCKYCGREFEKKRKNQEFCCKRCAGNASKVKRGITPVIEVEKTCKLCDKKFKTVYQRKQFCSKKCADKNRSNSHHYGQMSWASYVQNRKELAIQNKERKEIEKNWIKALHTVERECKICGSSFWIQDKSIRCTCSPECSQKYKNRRKDKRIPKAQIIDNDITIEKLYKRDQGRCYLCKGQCNFDDWNITGDGKRYYPGNTYPSIDHVIPISRGGRHSWDNVRLACLECNQKKGDEIIKITPLERNFAYSEKKTGTPPKKTAQITLDGDLIKIWDSTGQIKRELGYNPKRIQEICRGEGKTAFGFRWQYV